MENWEKECIKIVDKFLNMPIAKIFSSPQTSLIPTSSNNNSGTKNPQDLSSIRERLVQKKYKNFAAWKRDMKQIWSSARKIFNDDDMILAITDELEKRFNKMCNASSNARMQPIDWIQLVSSLYIQIVDITHNSSNQFSPFFKEEDCFVKQMTSKETIEKVTSQSNLEDRNSVLRASQLLSIFGYNLNTMRNTEVVSLKNIPKDAQIALSYFLIGNQTEKKLDKKSCQINLNDT
ncbi:hypothetical protein TRFO_38253 [Tritrichomonas foetus]|uniref:Bromo domain-containing protein n=1 Tax=Tritrichomonas foetus TaxID=1144522 RepID=A0A1J4JD71_9EUKA|nr:hypothetical protein TRFO_38253 [Tritrichomonas foetus]|eukprot:OHS95627.1 hypothetical protein TRFO_38253 [Tritrichomonas foetus]